MLALVLSGVIVGAFFGALVGLLETLAESMAKLPSILYWLLGSFAGATYEKVAIISGILLVAGTLLMMLRWWINLLSLGEDDATALGINVETLRWTIVALVSLIVFRWHRHYDSAWYFRQLQRRRVESGATATSQIPTHIVFDRVLVRGNGLHRRVDSSLTRSVSR